MNKQENWEIKQATEDDGLAPPPRALLSIALGGFVLLVLGLAGALVYMQNRASLANLFASGLQFALFASVVLLVSSLIFRGFLPRRTFPVLLVLLVVAWVVGSVVFAWVYHNQLAPGQREVAKNVLPFMSAFDPPLPPPDTSLPTPSSTEGDLNPEDLLNSPLLLGDATPLPQTIVEPTTGPNPGSAVIVPPTPTPTLAPATATPFPTMTPTVAGAVQPAAPNATQVALAANPALQRPAFAVLGGIKPVKQTWNNCGPANITMALSYFGWTSGQEVAQAYLRPSTEDKNVNPWELVNFVREETGFQALSRIGGSMEMLKQFIANRIPVVVETGYLYEGSDWLGHYETLVGYDDIQGVFLVYDSWLGTGENGNGIPRPYAEFDRNWEYFNRTFVAVYTASDESVVRAILGDLADPQVAAERAAETARATLQQDRQNAVAWFNLGSSLVRLSQFEEAATAYDQARRLVQLPWRMTWYQFGPFEAYYQVGRYDEVLSLVQTNLNNSGEYVEEMHFWKGRALSAQGDIAGARAAFRAALSHNRRYTAAQEALDALPA